MYEFSMPSLGADMAAGTLVEWKVKPGDRVRRGDVVAVVETDKGAIDVEIWQAGTVDRLIVEPGTKVPIGVTLAVLRTAEETAAGTEVPAPEIRPAEGAPPPQPKPAPADEEWRAGMRRAIAAAMSKSKREIPHYYLATDIDVTRTLEWLSEQNSERSVAERLLPVVPLMKAVALALTKVPGLNGMWKDDMFEPSPAVHLGMAISMRGGGLVAPAIRDAHTKNLEALMSGLRELIERVRAGRLRSSELTDATVTLTNLGDMSADRVYGIIYPPQVALVGFGRFSLRPWVRDRTVIARQIVTASLSADHRASDGHVGARFLSTLDGLLQAPEQLELA
jgi:pyruvate dehydrogenase E2 component (dihydrolipoamide acetyltransferase)